MGALQYIFILPYTLNITVALWGLIFSVFLYLDDLERLRCLSLLPTHDLPMFKIMIMLPACVKQFKEFLKFILRAPYIHQYPS
jgi:hypothetical protein